MVRPELLQKLNPAPDALLRALSEVVDDSMLREIAAADYDTHTEEHLRQLRRIRDEQMVLVPISWEPLEVLALTRWSEPDQTYPDAVEQNRRGHIIRAFACAALLRVDAEPLNAGSNSTDGQNQTLAQLLASLKVIANPFQVAALRFMAWRAQDLTDTYENGPFFILALLILILRTHADLTSDELQEMIDYLYAFESQTRSEQIICSDNPELWLLGLTNFDQKHAVWRQLGKEIGTLAVNYQDSAIEIALLDVSKRLVGEDTPEN